jgi:hypothetical protein
MQARALAAPSPSLLADSATVSTIDLKIPTSVKINDPKARDPIFLVYAKLNALQTDADPDFSGLESK